MPVLMSPDIATKFKEKWMLLHPDDRDNINGAVNLDDSLTSLHWLQNFSILSANPEKGPSSGCHPSHIYYNKHLPLWGTDSPSSPPAGDTAATGMPQTPGTSCSHSTITTSYSHPQAGPYSHNHMMAHMNPPEEIDYKTNRHVKPPYSYATLICMAMQASKKTKITLSEIYSWITENFCYYRHAEPSWQNSIRHNLSLNKCFMKVPRQKDEPGKGGFWQIDPQYADMFVNGVFKRRRMPATNFTTQRQSKHQLSSCGQSGQGSQHLGMAFYQGTGMDHKRKQAPPKRGGSKLARMPKSPLLATEAKGADMLRGDFDLASVFDDVLSSGGSTFEDLDINTALSSLGCEMELSPQGQHAAATRGKWYTSEDEQACAYLEASSMMGDLQHQHQQQQHRQLHHHQQQQHLQSHPLYYEGMTLFSDQHQLHPWEEIKEEPQPVPLSLDQGFGFSEGFFSEMQLWERAESYM
ncbi:hypothetical protein AALO_G00275950 [Alosa alosa]|uniref:Fork-head domain-containing protein n=1 Tax=Alosa alosa TaxID=278164 RepID=A0AAV6FI80_9TELE|nr:forkhead box protein J1-B [Alosa alosa]KAG5262514.1 hypothetical protein AALO_G00275950 [Alosa alosa]